MLSHPCGPKRRRYDIPLSSLPTAAAWATSLRQAGPLGDALGQKWNGKHSCGKRDSENNRGVRWAAAEGYSLEPEELEKDFRGMVRRLRQSPLRRATPRLAATGELWRQVVDPMRDNTPKKHGVGYKAQWIDSIFPKSTLAGHWSGEACGMRTNVVAKEYHFPD